MGIDLSKFRDEAVSSIPIKGILDGKKINIKGRIINFIEPIEYEGDIYRVDSDRVTILNINYKYKEDCGRCLEGFVNENQITLEAKLVTNINQASEDEDAIYYQDEELDIENYIMDTIILSLPMKPLCDEECKGLCPKCGTNHNEKKCDCVIENIDPRFEKLKNFFPNE